MKEGKAIPGLGGFAWLKSQVGKVEGVFGRLCVDCFGWRGGFIHIIKRHPAKDRGTMKTASAIVVIRELQEALLNEDKQG